MVDTLTTASAISRLIARAEVLPMVPPAPQGMKLIRTQKTGLVEGRYAQQIAFPRYILYQLWLRQRKPTEDSAKAYLHRMRGQALWRIALWTQKQGLPLPVRSGMDIPAFALRQPVVVRTADDPADWWDAFGTDASQYPDGTKAIQSDMRSVAAQEAQALAFQEWFYSDFLSDIQVMQLLDSHWNGQTSLWAGQEYGDAAGFRGSFSLVDPATDRYIRTMAGAFVTKINETTRKVLADSLWKLFSEENLSVDAIARRLPAMLKGTNLATMSRVRSHMIAVTEVARAETFGQMVAMAKTGVQKKQWVVTSGACGVCLDNQAAGAVPLMDAFPSGNYAPPGHIICRCDVTAAVSEDFVPGDWADYADADIDTVMLDPRWMNWSKEMGDLNLKKTWQETNNTGMLNYNQVSAVLNPGVIPDLQQRLGNIVDVEASYNAFAQRYSQKTGIPLDQLLLQQGTLDDLLSRFTDMSVQGSILAEIERSILSQFKTVGGTVGLSSSDDIQKAYQSYQDAKVKLEEVQQKIRNLPEGQKYSGFKEERAYLDARAEYHQAKEALKTWLNASPSPNGLSKETIKRLVKSAQERVQLAEKEYLKASKEFYESGTARGYQALQDDLRHEILPRLYNEYERLRGGKVLESIVTESSRLKDLLDDRNTRESASETKERIGKQLAGKLQDNPKFQSVLEKLRGTQIPWANRTIQTPEDAASYLVHQWAKGYDDSGLLSALQSAVKAEFKIKGSYKVIDVALGMKNYKDVMPGLQEFVREMYTQTQAWFKAQGITHVALFRGMSFERLRVGFITDGKVYLSTSNLTPFSAFSTDYKVALEGFAKGGNYETMIGSFVPVGQILSTSQTGFGCKGESEVVVLGPTVDGKMITIKYSYDALPEEILTEMRVYNLANPELGPDEG